MSIRVINDEDGEDEYYDEYYRDISEVEFGPKVDVIVEKGLDDVACLLKERGGELYIGSLFRSCNF